MKWLLLLLLAFLAWLGSKLFGGSGGAAPPAPLPLPPPYPSTGTATLAGGPTVFPQGTWDGPTSQARLTTHRYTFKRQNWNAIAAIGDQLTDAPNVAVRLRLQVEPGEDATIVETADVRRATGTPWWGAITASDGTVVVDVSIGPRSDENLFAESDLFIIAEELDINGSVRYGAWHKVRLVAPGQ